MIASSLDHAYRRLRQWWRRSSRGKSRSGRRHRPPVVETLETRMVPTGTWTALNHPPLDEIGTMMLLSDGTVMAQGAGGPAGVSQHWYRLTPDGAGNYADGTWTALAPMHLARLYFGSNVLPDGRVFLVGGEYSGNQGRQNFANTGEIYNPITNTWTNITPFPRPEFGDDPTEVLPDGRILAGYLSGPQTFIYNPATNTWATGPNKMGAAENSDEESWVKLPDDSILTYDIYASRGAFQGERYIPSTNVWMRANTVDSTNPPKPLSDPTVGYELGPAFLLPDGRAFFLGGGYRDPMGNVTYANTAYYDPGTDTWTAGPVIPNQLGADDAPGAMMPNGHILFAADHLVPSYFTGPTSIFEFDPTAQPPNLPYTDVTPPSSVIDLSGPAYPTRMLMLPSGQVLLGNGGRQLAVYTPMGNPSNAWKPTISGITSDGRGTYTLTGTQLNGISEGANYGDDAEMSSNFPLVRLTASNGRVYYARTFNWSSTGVATNSTPVTTQFTLPANLPEGTFNLTVVANGIASDNYPFTFTRATHFSVTPSLTSVVAGTPFTVTVRALDTANQLITNYRGTVHFTSDDAQAALPPDYAFTAADAGVHTFSVTLATAGTDQVVATDTGNSSLTGRTAVTVSPADLDHLAVSTTAGNPQVAGAAFDITVKAEDAFNNTVPGYTGLVMFSSGDPRAVLPADYQFTAADNGVHTFAAGATLFTAGVQDVTATDAANSLSSTVNVTVVAAAAVAFRVTAPASVVAGVPFDVTVVAVDPYGNTDTGYTGTVTFTTSDPNPGVVLPADYTFQASDQGMMTFTAGATLLTAGPQTITVTDTTAATITGMAAVTVVAAPASAFRIMAPSTIPPGAPFDVTVIAVDPYGNTATGYTGTVTFSSSDSDPGVVLPPDYTFQPSDQGMVTFTRGVTLITLGDQTVTATDTADNTITGSATVTVMGGFARNRRRDLAGLTLAPPQPAPAPIIASATGLQPASIDRFFSVRGSDLGQTTPGLKPPAEGHFLLKPHDDKSGDDAIRTDLALEQMVL